MIALLFALLAFTAPIKPAPQPPVVVYVASACAPVTVTYATADGSEQDQGSADWFAVEPLTPGRFYYLSAQKSQPGDCMLSASILVATLPASVPPAKVGDYAVTHGQQEAGSYSTAPFGIATVHWT
ncbi:MAG: hypothetical protein ACRD13_03005, partial [Terriglobales bacterium]